jgi:Uri superfamily endonuclease
VGRLGIFGLRPSFYVYVGSALGPGGLAARIGRHARQKKTWRWHVDYLRSVSDLVEVRFSPGGRRQECLCAERLAEMQGSRTAMPGFGASDCGCQSHLFYFRDRPVPKTAPINVWRPARRQPSRPFPVRSGDASKQTSSCPSPEIHGSFGRA